MALQRTTLWGLGVAMCLAASSGAAADGADADWTIVAFGDSTTAPRGELTVYSDILQKELATKGMAVRVINAGVGGNHTELARARFEQDVLARQPDVVVIQFGINDSAVDVWREPAAAEPRVSLSDYEQNLRHFIDVLNDKDVRVLLMTPNPLRWTDKLREMYGKPPYVPDDEDGFSVMLKEYAGTVRRVAESTHVELIDVYQAFEQYGRMENRSVDDLLLDGMHPNERGQRLVADLLMAALLKPDPVSSSTATPPAKESGDRDVDRTFGNQQPRTHPGQWQQSDQATLLTDMTRFTPAAALSEHREHDKWKIFEYETAGFSGRCLSIGRESSAPDLTLKLGREGWHAVYIGLSTITNLVRADRN
ncbi:MAG: hypothetical protein KDA75_15930, partial [Planctomycetaceae bacterium]|nr:hypothetical protein [Planctomycetaceae bacterium]